MVEKSTLQHVIQTRVTIKLQARLKNHPDISRSINTSVLIENYE
jgi:prepilin peptidase dependent protein B